MGRPLNKKTLALLRPTANVSVSSSELPANILRQRTSTGFLVQTADGENLCTLTADEPQPGQMRLQAFAADGSSYYVTDISKELITIQHGTGNTIPSGSKIGWDLNVSTDQSLILANKTLWKWLNIDGTAAGLWGFNITSDKSIYFWGYTNNNINNVITKISPIGNIEWSTELSQNLSNPAYGLGGIPTNTGETYVVNSDDTSNLTYIAKINIKGEVLWQKQGTVYNGNGSTCYYAYVDSKNNINTLFDEYSSNAILKFDTNGNIVYQKNILPPVGYGLNVVSGCFLSDDTFIVVPYLSKIVGPEQNGSAEIIRLSNTGSVINQFAINDYSDPINSLVVPLAITQDFSSSIICSGKKSMSNPVYAFIAKLSLQGQIIWQNGYSNGIDTVPDLLDLKIDADNNIYAIYVGDSTNITKWNSNGDLVWQIKIKNSDNSLYFNYTPTSFQIIDSHLYAAFYHYTGGIYDQQFIIKINKDNPELGSFTEPYQYTITDAADDGYGVVVSNLAITTSNVSIADSNYTFTNTAFSQENITINYDFGF